MTLLQEFSTAFGKYATFEGRSRRREFWGFMLISTIIESVAAGIYGNIVGSPDVWEGVLSLLFFVPSLAVAVRRLHDTGRSGAWLLLALTGIGLIPLAIMMMLNGDAGRNKYGSDPKGQENNFDPFGDDVLDTREYRRARQEEELYV